MSRPLRAVDVKRVPAAWLSWNRMREGVPVDDLPTCLVDEPARWKARRTETAAITSWRWDMDSTTRRSRNVALALKHAQESGVDHLFVDVVSVGQAQPRDDLLRSVVELANLFELIPVIAAYDEPDGTGDTWDHTLRRPWILSEIRAFCKNPTRVTNVGFRRDETDRNGLSFANQVSRIRSDGYAACILDVLHGRVAMTDVADFRLILAEFSEAISACYEKFGRGDYLFAVFLLTAKYERHQVVERHGRSSNYGFRTEVANFEFDQFGLERFTLVPNNESVYYGFAKTIVFDGQEVAVWRSRMTTSYDRNWVEVLSGAEDRILDAVHLSPEARAAYGKSPHLRTTFLRIDKDAPIPRIRERAASVTRGGWMEKVPRPSGVTIGFNPELWGFNHDDFG